MDYMEELAKKIEENPRYAAVLPVSVMLHQFSRKHQDLSKPRLFLKEFDNSGWIVKFDLNKMYKGLHSVELASLMNEFEKNARERIMESVDWLSDEELFSRLNAMVIADNSEELLYKTFRRINPSNAALVDAMPPIIERVYDDKPVPVFGYRFNDRIVKVGDDLSIQINGFPISPEESQKMNIEGLMGKLFGGN